MLVSRDVNKPQIIIKTNARTYTSGVGYQTSKSVPEENTSWEKLFAEAIKDHEQGVDGDKEAVRKAYKSLESIVKMVPRNNLVKAYFGSATCLLGRDAVDPMERFEKAVKGLKILDEAVSNEPENTKIRILRGYVCYRLPETYFHRTSTAVEDFKYLITRYENEQNTFSPEFYNQLLYDLGVAYKTLGRKEEAVSVWEKLLKTTAEKRYQDLLRREGLPIPDCDCASSPADGEPDPSEREADLAKGIVLHQQALAGDKAAARDALGFFSRKMEEYPQNPLIMAYTADCLSLAGRDAPKPEEMFAGAIKGMKLFDTAVNADPANIEIRLLRARQSLRLPEGFFRRTATAITDLEYLINRYEEDSSVFPEEVYHELLYELGTAYRRLGLKKEGEAVWKKLLSLATESEYKKLIQEETTVNLTAKAPKDLSPENRDLFFAEGRRLHDLAVAGKKQATPLALELWRKAFAADPMDPVAEAYYGSCLALTGRDASDPGDIFSNTIQGLKHLNRAIGRDWSNPELRLLRGYLCYSLPESFFHLTERAVKDLRFVKMSYETGNASVSKDLYHRVLYDLGMAYQRLGQNAEAQKVWKKLMKENPESEYLRQISAICFDSYCAKEEKKK